MIVKKGEASISQKACFIAIVDKFGLANANPGGCPMAPGAEHVLEVDTGPLINDIPYGQAVGKLQYAAGGTRPDIAYATRTAASVT